MDNSNTISLKTGVVILCPQLVTLEKDRLGSGIPYMPVTAAYLASVLRTDYDITVIDAFGEDPFNAWIEDKYIIQGLSFENIPAKIPPDTKYCIVYVSTVMANYVIQKTIRLVSERFPNTDIIAIENTQGVIGCSLEYMYQDFFASGAKYILAGECEESIPALLGAAVAGEQAALEKIPGLIFKNDKDEVLKNNPENIKNLDSIPFPAWDLFPLGNYRDLNYSHGPMQSAYLPLLTSRGCPYNCAFCVAPSMNRNSWRPRSPRNVVDEIEFMQSNYGISEFHLEDLNPTSNEKRIIEICGLLLEKGLKISWKLASGSKIETVKIETLKLMKKAGCSYISFSPESGSKRVLKMMKKPFNHKYALQMTGEMNRLGIKSQACFVLGFPGETRKDRMLTAKYIRQLTSRGVDEIALFIMTPIPGTRTFGDFAGYSDYSELTFAPTWRSDYTELCSFRNRMYRNFLLYSAVFHPGKTLWHMVNLLNKRFETKSEMNIYRLLKIREFIRKSGN